MKKLTVVLLAMCVILGLCACEKPVLTMPSDSSASTVSEVIEKEEESPFSLLSEDARMIAEFTQTDPGEFEDIRDLDYYTDYVDSMYDLPRWKAFGTAAMIYGYEPTKTQEQVAKYLNEKAPEAFVFLFEAFFNKKYATEEIIEYVQSYAYYLTKATLENHSFAEFAENDYRKEWFKAVGCTREYDYDEYDRLIEDGVSHSKEGITEIGVGRHKWVYGAEVWVKDAQELYSVIHDGYESFDYMEEVVKADAPVFFESYSKDKYVIVELGDSSDGASYTYNINYDCSRILLSFASAEPHEYVHSLTVRGGDVDSQWIREGVAEYYSVKNAKGEGVVHHSAVDYMNGIAPEDIWDGVEPSERQRLEPLMTEARETFNAYKEKYGDNYSEDLYAYLAIAEKEIETGELIYSGSVLDAYSSNGIRRGGKTGLASELSYAGACVVVKEMIKDFGAEKVLSYVYIGGDFKTLFGMSSAEYLETVRERGSYKLGFFCDTPYNND